MISLLTALLLASPAILHAADDSSQPKPNILFILADDFGWRHT